MSKSKAIVWISIYLNCDTMYTDSYMLKLTCNYNSTKPSPEIQLHSIGSLNQLIEQKLIEEFVGI